MSSEQYITSKNKSTSQNIKHFMLLITTFCFFVQKCAIENKSY